jgi:CO/xanthine dehydrogenase Mo-binding subunit
VTNKLNYVGQPAAHIDGVEKTTGKARYVDDYQIPGMLVGAVLRSPIPHGHITRLDVTPALAVPGVHAAITHADFVDDGHFGWPVKDAYVLAYGKVRCVGDPVAAVAADTPEAARAGLEAIIVAYEPLPAVTDLMHALDEDTPIIPLEPGSDDPNLVGRQIVRNGDPAAVLVDCPVVLDEVYYCAHQEQAYLEPEGALALPDADGGVTVYANDQSPFINRNNLVMLLGLPEDRVRVIQAVVGGSFGGKDDIGYQTSAQAARLALKTGRPVKLSLSREESMLASYKREAMQYRVRLGVDDAGCLRAAQINATADSGAYASMTPLAAWRATVHAAGAYRYAAVTVDTDVVYTNNAYSGAFRGFGNTESAAVIEQAVDELADRLGEDPIAFRLRNCLRTGDRAMTGNVIEHEIGLAACLEWVRDQSDWARKRAAYADQDAAATIRRGLGVACYFHGSSLGGEGADYATATLTIENDYTLTLTSGLTDYGQGSRTVFTLIAAEAMGLPPERVHMPRPDTRRSIESGPTVASRATMVGGNATRIASMKLDRTLRWAAAHALGCTPDAITRHGEAYISPAEDALPFEQVVDHARQMGLLLNTSGHWRVPHFEWDFERGTGIPYFCYVFGAQVAEVAHDTLTGATRVLNIWATHDGGQIVYPQGARGQMIGGIAQGMGYALLEDMAFDAGYARHTNFDGYLIPTAADMPHIESTFIHTDFPAGPYGAKNLAEPVMIGTAPAILNALAQATGIRRRTLPMTLERALLGHDLVPPGGAGRCRTALGYDV